MPGSQSAVAPGYYVGSITGQPESTLAAIIGPDRSIALRSSNGSVEAAGSGILSSAGTFSVNTSGGAFVGKVDPATGFLTGSLSGTGGGGFTAAAASGGPLSDGFLRNLSTRARVDTGAGVLIAGFVVGGTTSKQLLIRAIGPSLAAFGITNPLADPQLQIYDGQSNPIAASSNNDWGGSAELETAFAKVGAFPLSPTSLDAAVLVSLAPGAYTAQVSGSNGVTGVGLVEIYDIDNLAPSSPKKVINLSTRGLVGPAQDQMNQGFMISGNIAKQVLIRAAGPGLSAVMPSLAGSVLADPVLRLVRIMPDGSQLAVRENDNWETGNDVSLVTDAATKVGAFPFAAGSKDAVILANVPPGTYSAVVSGPGSATGLVLLEVYEVR